MVRGKWSGLAFHANKRWMVRGKWSGLAFHTRITAIVLIDVQIVNPLASTSIFYILTICVGMGSLDLSISDSFCINSKDKLWLVSTGHYLMQSTAKEARKKIWQVFRSSVNPQMITRFPRFGKGEGVQIWNFSPTLPANFEFEDMSTLPHLCLDNVLFLPFVLYRWFAIYSVWARSLERNLGMGNHGWHHVFNSVRVIHIHRNNQRTSIY